MHGQSVVSLTLAIVWSLIFSACTPNAHVPDDEIRIGQFNSLTGPEGTFGQSTDKGIRLAIDAANAAGGIKGKRINLITEDNQSKPEEISPVVKKLITQDKVVALLGEVASTRSRAAAFIAQPNKIPMITPSSTNPNITAVGNYIFRVCFIDPVQGPIMARFASEELKIKRVAIMKDLKSDYSLGLTDFFTRKFKELGGEVVTVQTYSSGDADFKAQLTQVRAANPEAIFVPGYYNDLGPMGRQARELGLKAVFLGGDGWESPKLFELSAGSLEGGYFSTHYALENPNAATQEFVKNFRQKYQVGPDGLAAAGFDAAGVLLAAMRRAPDLKPSSIRDEIARTTEYDGATGRITINHERNADKDVFVVKIVGKDLKFTKVYKH